MDVLLLSRIQFAFTVGFHYIYPPLSIGLGIVLVIMEGLWIRTGEKIYHEMARFWTKIFALTFAIGVATGIVMEFEFGTNWATYSRYVGDVFGSALAAEGIFAFFLESGFLAVLLFGWNKVGPKLHFFSTCMVCLGAHFSAVWIIVANSWQQTPAGYHIVGEGLHARAEITDFWAMVFSPSSMDRLSHTLMGAWQAGSFFVISVSAYYLMQRRHLEFAKRSIKVGLTVALVASLGQLITGDISARHVATNQPAKLAAFEGHYATEPAPLYLFGWVNENQQRVQFGIAIPKMLSYLTYGDANKPVTGLNDIKPDERPPINFVFQTYHAMVAIGMLLIALSLFGVYLWWSGRLFGEEPWVQKFVLPVMVFSVLGPQLANQLGWFSAEVGRQPWIVYGLLRTSDALSKVVTADVVLTSLILFTAIYLLLFILFIFLLNEKIQHGPETEKTPDEVHPVSPTELLDHHPRA
ncbi:MAG: cytochrome ubiquinol oxidase subunit I [Methylacidiphilales bacterium]|nr:cytochrome ubiquinol oxidase subunit I [Candidatus Methylacidiphilales bacterium]